MNDPQPADLEWDHEGDMQRAGVTPLPLAKSSWLTHASYSKDARRLVVGFKSGIEFAFEDVPQEIADGLSKAESPGSYFGTHIRGHFDAAGVPRGRDEGPPLRQQLEESVAAERDRPYERP